MTDFTPKDATARTIMFIEGDNFGTKLQNIKVYIGGKEAPVTGSNGKTVSVMVPKGTNESIADVEKGIARASVRVEILKDDGSVYFDKVFADSLSVKGQMSVGTLTGYKDPLTGQSSRIDGPFEDAQFISPWWLELTHNKIGEKVLIVHDGDTNSATGGNGYLQAVREVNLETRMVGTLLTRNQIGINQGLSLAMDPTGDTLFILNDNGKGEWNDRYAMPAIYYALRSEGFVNSRVYQYAQCCYSGVWMTDGSFFYNTWNSPQLLKGRDKYNATNGIWDGKQMFDTGAQSHQFMMKHPTENYMYTTGTGQRVRRVPYNKTTKMFENSIAIIAGSGGAGFREGTGTEAQFDSPRQGVFVLNPNYTGDELYDFYVGDQYNHCIWKVTPSGASTVFAGRGSVGMNNDKYGWIDGDLIETARFNQPVGIAYDDETGIFYVADRENRRIRTIQFEY
jgi:hypothetical protein